jgi:hypothetical protein
VIPSTPQPNTGITAPLVTIPQYRQTTKDTTTENEDVTEALLDAEQMVCERCVKTLRYGQYVETQYVYPDGKVYPSATPLDRTKPILAGGQSIYNPATTQSAVIQGAGVLVGWFQPAYLPVLSGSIPPQTVITYWGGYQPYQADPATTQSLPRSLATILARVAYYSIMAKPLDGVQGNNIKSISVGGVSISGDLDSFLQADSGLRRDMRKWRTPQVKAWAS